MAQYQVTPQQYERLISARDNWPERLSAKRNYMEGNGCVDVYLARHAGIETSGSDKLSSFESEGLQEISRFYGIPLTTVWEWAIINDFYGFSVILPIRSLRERKVARKMRKEFDKFLQEVAVSETKEVNRTYNDQEIEEEVLV